MLFRPTIGKTQYEPLVGDQPAHKAQSSAGGGSIGFHLRSKFAAHMVLAVTLLTGGAASAEGITRDQVLSFDTRGALAALEDALIVHDEIPTLESSKMLGRDQRSANEDLDDLVQEAIGVFESDLISGLRAQYRKLEDDLESERNRLTGYRAERILASREDPSLRAKLVPGETLKRFVAVSRADYDALIETTQQNIANLEEEKANTIVQMSKALNAIGVELNSDQLEVMMASVIGDDIVTMSVVFNAIKDMTNQLAELTQESGENLAHAKKYYGMVVMLHRIIAAMQENFVKQVDEKYLPKLEEYRQTAQANIKESRELVNVGTGVATLENNIRSNKLTIEVIDLYSGQLKSQRKKVSNGLEVTLREMNVANNTYNTVSLSSAVVSMIREGSNTFEHLISIQMPDVHEFQNDEVREEFRAITAKLNM